MTYFEKGPKPEIGKFLGFHHIELFVGNAKQAASFYIARYGFEPVAYKGLETGQKDYCQWVVRHNQVRLVFTCPYSANETLINQHLAKHGDGVRDVAFQVEDAKGIYQKAVTNGAVSVRAPETVQDENGSVILASVQTYGDTVHTFVEYVDYKGPFLPGYKELSPDPINQAFDKLDLQYIDHIVGNQPNNEMTATAEWYIKHLQFHKYWSVDEKQIHTEYSALRSVVVADYDEIIKMPINEPAEGKRKSQIQEYVDFYYGPGVQHIALHTDNIIHTVTQLRARGVEFLTIPDSYYDLLRQRLANSQCKITEDFDKIQELRILVDFDEQGYLLQLFTKPVQDRPTLFFEFIQRRNNNGFGIGNFKALFESLELEQQRRGNL